MSQSGACQGRWGLHRLPQPTLHRAHGATAQPAPCPWRLRFWARPGPGPCSLYHSALWTLRGHPSSQSAGCCPLAFWILRSGTPLGVSHSLHRSPPPAAAARRGVQRQSPDICSGVASEQPQRKRVWPGMGCWDVCFLLLLCGWLPVKVLNGLFPSAPRSQRKECRGEGRIQGPQPTPQEPHFSGLCSGSQPLSLSLASPQASATPHHPQAQAWMVPDGTASR